MSEMKARLFIDTTIVNSHIIRILREHLGDVEAVAIAESDCIAYLVSAYLNSSWVSRRFNNGNLVTISKEHSYRILEDYMSDLLEEDGWELEKLTDDYQLTAQALSNDAELMRSVYGVLSIITRQCSMYSLQQLSKTVWVLNYIERD